MGKKSKIIIGILILSLLVVVIMAKMNFNRGYKISITNDSNKTVEKLELKYKSGNKIQTISKIEPEKSWKYTVDTSILQGENAIILSYKDNMGNSYKEYVVGYLEKGYSGKTNVIINNIDENGKLEIELK